MSTRPRTSAAKADIDFCNFNRSAEALRHPKSAFVSIPRRRLCRKTSRNARKRDSCFVRARAFPKHFFLFRRFP